MPILADAYSDAHLNLDTLDRDISEALKKVEVAAGRFEQTLKIKVDLDTAAADTKLKDLQLQAQRTREAIEANSATITVDIDSDAVLSELAALEQLKADLSSDPINIGVDFDSAQAESKIQELKALLDAIDKNITIKMEIDGDFTNALNQLAELNTAKEQLDGDIEIDVNLNENVLDEFAAIETLKDELGRDINFGIDANTGDLLDDLAAIEALKQTIGRDVSVNVDVDTGGALAKLASLRSLLAGLSGGGGLLGSLFGGGGLGGLSGLAGPAFITAIAGAVAALAPFVTGLIGGAVALIGFGAAAGVAAGGLAALALFTDTGLKETFATLGSNFARLTRDVLDPLINFFESTVGPALFSVLTELTLKLGPSIQGFLEPVLGTFFEFFLAIANSAAPLLDDLGNGIGVLINSFTRFVPELIPVAELLAGPFFNALSGIIELFLGTAATAGPAVASLLNGIGDGARGLIEPINNLVRSFTPLLQSVGPGLSEALGQLGPLWRDLGATFFEVINLITSVINTIGLQELITLISGVIGAFSLLSGNIFGIAIAFGGLALGSNQLSSAVTGIKRLLESLAPAFAAVANVARTVADAVFAFFDSLFASINTDDVGNALAGLVAPIQAIASGLLAIAPTLGTAIGAIINVIGKLLPLLQIFIAYKLATVLIGIGGAFKSVATTISSFVQAVSSLAATRGVSFFQALRQSALASIPAITGVQIATVALTAALTIAIGVYTAWSQARAEGDQVSKGVRDSLIAEGEVLNNLTEAYQNFIDQKGLSDAFNEAGLSARDLVRSIEEAPGAVDAFRNVWDDDIPGLGAEALPTTIEDLEQLEAAVQAKGATIPEAIRKIFLANIETGGVIDEAAVKDFINTLTEVDQGAADTITSLEQRFRDAQIEIDISGIQVDPADLDAVRQAFATGDINASRQALINLADEYPELRDAINIVAAETSDYGEAAAEAEAALAKLGLRAQDVYNAQLPEASRALAGLAQSLDEGTINAKAFERAQENAKNSTGGLADSTKNAVRQIRNAGSLSEFFRIEADQIESAAQRAQKFAQAFVQGVTLGGRLSERVRNEAVEVERTLDSFLSNLQLQGDNARRLSALTAQGFGTLAVQLASLASNPEQLRGFLNELGSRGQAGFAEANGRLQAGIDEFARVVRSLDPVTRQALGLDETLAALEEEKSNIFSALDDFAKQVFLKISNLRRLRQLQEAGFQPLALRLATDLFGDPKALDAALNTLEAGGRGALVNANNLVRNLANGLEREFLAADSQLAAAAGFDLTEEAANQGIVDLTKVLEERNKLILIQLENVARLKFLRQGPAEFGSLAAVLFEQFKDDPATLKAYLDQFAALGPEAQRALAEGFSQSQTAGEDAVAKAAQELVNSVTEGITTETEAQGTAAYQAGLLVADNYNNGVKQGIEDGLGSKLIAGTEEAFRRTGAAAAQGPGAPTSTGEGGQGPTPNTTVVPEAFRPAAALAANAFIEGFAGEVRKISEALIAEVIVGPDKSLLQQIKDYGQPEAGGLFYETGRTLGTTLLDGFATALQDQTASVNGAIETFIKDVALNDGGMSDTMKQNLKLAGQNAAGQFLNALQLGLLGTDTEGQLSIVDLVLFMYEQGASLGLSVANGFASEGDNAANRFYDELFKVLETLVGLENTTGVATKTAGSIGNSFGLSLALGLNTAAAANIKLGDVFQTLSNASFFIGFGAAQAFGIGFTTAYAIASVGIAAQIGLSIQGLNAGITQVLGEGGRAAGDALAKSMVAAINSPLILEQLRTAVFFFVVEAQTTIGQNGPNIGREFINGINTGVTETAPVLLTTIRNVATLIAEVMRQALDINSPSGVGMTLGNQFIQGIAVGLQESTGQLTTVASGVRSALVGALAQPVTIGTAVAGSSGFGVAAPAAAVVATPAGPVSDTVLLQQMLIELQAQNAELRAVAARPLIGEYNVTTTREPQSPEQLTQDASFAKALLL